MKSLLLSMFMSACATAAPHRTTFPAHSIPLGHIDEDDLRPTAKLFDERVAEGDKVIFFRIDSSGGSLDDGFDFMKHVRDVAHTHKLKILCAADWKAFSMAFVFFELNCHERYLTDFSILGTHMALMSGVTGHATVLRERASELDSFNSMLSPMLAKRLKMSAAEYASKVQNGAVWYLGPDEAIKAHAADKIIDVDEIPEPFEVKKSPEAIIREALGI